MSDWVWGESHEGLCGERVLVEGFVHRDVEGGVWLCQEMGVRSCCVMGLKEKVGVMGLDLEGELGRVYAVEGVLRWRSESVRGGGGWVLEGAREVRRDRLGGVGGEELGVWLLCVLLCVWLFKGLRKVLGKACG